MSKAALMQDLFLILAIAGAGAVLSLWGLLFFAAGASWAAGAAGRKALSRYADIIREYYPTFPRSKT